MNPVRRVSESLREMRWAQLFLELVLLVLGILIALAVDGWMDDRRDARLERQYLERLARDLDQNIGILREFVDFEEKQVADGILAYRALRGVEPAEREAVSQAIDHLATRRTVRFVRATYTDLLSTGNLGLIRDPALRDAVVNLYEVADRVVTVTDRNNQVVVEQMFALPLAESGLVAPRPTSNLPDASGDRSGVFERLGAPVDETQDRLWTLPEGSPERAVLTSRILRRVRVGANTRALVETLERQVQEVRAAVEAALAR